MTDVKPGEVAERLEKLLGRYDAFNGDESNTTFYVMLAQVAHEARTAASLIRSLSERVEKLEGAGVHLCAAVDNLWNHPDLVRVRAEIPESINLNISRGQMMTRAALERK